MITSRKFEQSSFFRNSGFALVYALLFTVLLSALAISMLTFTASITKRAASSDDLQIAKANARLALQLALSELQLHAGPDQRTTATAAILDSNPTSESIDGVNHPLWTGVWSCVDKDGKPLLQVDSSTKASGIIDTRKTGDRLNHFKKWLVSQPNPNATLDARTYTNDANNPNLVTLVPARGKHAAVLAHKLQSQQGALAWWVGDEGVKAHLAIPHDFHGKNPKASGPDSNYAWLTASPSTQPSALRPEWAALEKPSLALPSRQSISLAAHSVNNDYFHDFTTISNGLLTDTLRGGLRKNLSAYLLEGNQPELANHSAGINDASRLIGPMDTTDARLQGIVFENTKYQKMSPRFGLLKSWIENGETAAKQNNSIDLTLPNHAAIKDDDLINQQAYDLQNQTKSALKPYLVEGSIFYNITHYTPPGSSAKRLRVHVYPRVALWNPYRVAIKLPTLAVYLRVTGERPLIIDKKKVTMRLPSLPGGHYGDGISQGSFVFSLEETTIGPGECLVFSKKAPDSTSYNPVNVSNNILSAQAQPGNQNFYLDSVITNSFATIPPNFSYRFESGGKTQDLSLDLKTYPGATPPVFTISDLREKWVLLQKVNYHHAFGDGNNPETVASWNTTSDQPILPFAQGKNATPYYKTKDGARMRWLQETQGNIIHAGGSPAKDDSQFLSTAPIANHNFHAWLSVRTPNDDFLDNTTPRIFSHFMRDVWDEQSGWQSTEPIPLANNKWGGNPFAPTSEWARDQYVLFDIPDPIIGVTSLAQFQHAPISAYAWHSSSPIGNSWGNPLGPVTSTAPEYSEFAGWNSASLENKDRADQARDLLQVDVTSFPHTGNQSRGKEPDQLMYDLCYEINHALWDRFFLTGNRSSELLAYLKKDSPTLKNARLRPHSSPFSVKSDYHHAARHLEIIGAFNVNSTSPLAWQALLLSTFNKSPDQDSASNQQAAFPRLLIPAKGSANQSNPVDPNDSADAWNGYRSLSKSEVETLSLKIVEQVKKRGPFLSLSDFINRRLVNDSTGRLGTLQAAIDEAQLNKEHDALKINLSSPQKLLGVKYRSNHGQKPTHKSAGATAYLQSADILQPLGPSLAARSDTFVIRAYGEAKDRYGNVTAKVWCEATVQRTTEPVQADVQQLNPTQPTTPAPDLGRRFVTTHFRWLNQNEL